MGLIQSVTLVIFISLGGFITILPHFITPSVDLGSDEESIANDPVMNESFFHKIKYFSQKKGEQELHLNATDLTLNKGSSKTVFFGPEGKTFTASGKEIFYKANRGEFITKDDYLELEGSVVLDSEDSQIKAEKVDFYGNRDLLVCKGDVFSTSFSKTTGDEIEVRADSVRMNTATNYSRFIGNVQGKVKRKKAYEQNVSFSSQKMQLDMRENKAYLQEEVFFKKRAVKAYSRSGEIFLENYNKRLKYFVLFDDVRVVEKVKTDRGRAPKSFERKAFSEKLEGIISEGKIILSGYPKVLQQGDTIKGNLIILREDVDVIEVVDANTNFKVGN